MPMLDLINEFRKQGHYVTVISACEQRDGDNVGQKKCGKGLKTGTQRMNRRIWQKVVFYRNIFQIGINNHG